jgi:hypothetical protein
MRFPGRPRGLGCCQRGGNVGGEGVQLRVGREHLADPQIKLVFSQPSLHERGLERIEHLLAVGLRRYQAAAAARARCYLVSGHSYLTSFPMSTIYGKRSVPVLSVRHPQMIRACLGLGVCAGDTSGSGPGGGAAGPAVGVAGRVRPEKAGGEQAPGPRDGQRDHPGAGRRRLVTF